MQNTDLARLCGFFGLFAAVSLVVPGCAGQIVEPGARSDGVIIGENGERVSQNAGPNGSNKGFGLTFGIADDKSIGPDLVHPSCHGFPKVVEQDWRGSCNPYSGDTSCQSARPILCVRMDQSAAPPNVNFDFYNGWVPGVLATTSPIVGQRLTSLAAADAFCADELGQGFRMASFHDADGDGGWTFIGKRGAMNEQARHWVFIADQPGNCWNATR